MLDVGDGTKERVSAFAMCITRGGKYDEREGEKDGGNSSLSIGRGHGCRRASACKPALPLTGEEEEEHRVG